MSGTSSASGNFVRAIDIREGDKVDEDGVKALIQEAVLLNASKTGKR
jgi:hypothetical protein